MITLQKDYATIAVPLSFIPQTVYEAGPSDPSTAGPYEPMVISSDTDSEEADQETVAQIMLRLRNPGNVSFRDQAQSSVQSQPPILTQATQSTEAQEDDDPKGKGKKIVEETPKKNFTLADMRRAQVEAGEKVAIELQKQLDAEFNRERKA